VALILLGVTPFLVRLAPTRMKPDPESLVQGALYGSSCMSLMLLTGVAGPLLDAYLVAFLAVGASLVGTMMAKPFLLAMSDMQYRLWAGRLITAIAAYYVLHGAALLQMQTVDTAAM
jgi:uncharacterized membrane protein